MIFLEDEQNLISADENSGLIILAAQILESLGHTNEDLTIVLSDNEDLKTLNQKYLGNDAPTDVLSFTANEINPETGGNYLGDILISIDQVRIQASEQEISGFEELITLVVHGILHLCGWDHADRESEKKMFAKQNEYVKEFLENHQ